MNEQAFEESWWLLSRARGVGLVLRVLILVSPVLALVCTRFAANDNWPIVTVPVIALAWVCVVFPDSHIGLLVVLLVAIGWLATVDELATPWSIGVAVALTVFHASVAGVTVAPPSARWSRAMCRRWLLRSSVVMVASAGTWVVVVALYRYEIASSQLLVAGSLTALAVAGLWARSGSFGVDRSEGG